MERFFGGHAGGSPMPLRVISDGYLQVPKGLCLVLEVDHTSEDDPESKPLFTWYLERRDPTVSSCILDIKAEIMTSIEIKAVFELYKRVWSERGYLVCAGYPLDYLPAL